MATESKYHEKIKTFMRSEGRPVTLREIMEGVGISRPAVYQWKDRHSRELREMGAGKFSAMSYELVENGTGTAGRRRRSSTVLEDLEAVEVAGVGDGAMPDVAAGMRLTVTGVRLLAGHVVLDVATDGGEPLTLAVL